MGTVCYYASNNAKTKYHPVLWCQWSFFKWCFCIVQPCCKFLFYDFVIYYIVWQEIKGAESYCSLNEYFMIRQIYYCSNIMYFVVLHRRFTYMLFLRWLKFTVMKIFIKTWLKVHKVNPQINWGIYRSDPHKVFLHSGNHDKWPAKFWRCLQEEDFQFFAYSKFFRIINANLPI